MAILIVLVLPALAVLVAARGLYRALQEAGSRIPLTLERRQMWARKDEF